MRQCGYLTVQVWSAYGWVFTAERFLYAGMVICMPVGACTLACQAQHIFVSMAVHSKIVRRRVLIR